MDLRLALALSLAAGLGIASATAQVVDLHLVLAVDTSGSVDERRFELQKQGYVAAFRNPKVLDAIRSGATQSIAVTMTQWTGPALQVQTVPWTLLKDAASGDRFAALVEDVPRQLFFGGTSISGAIDHARTLFPQSPFRGGRHVIDVSGDGSNNRGRLVNQARDEAVDAGIIINGLPILALEPDLERYYRDNVIGGPGAFVIAAKEFETFGDAILRKLIAEIASHPVPGDSAFAALAKSAGTPQFPGLTIVYLSPLGNPADARHWRNIVVHQAEGPDGTVRNGAREQARNSGRRGVTIRIETDGTVYWAMPETMTPSPGEDANRNDSKYAGNAAISRKVLGDNSIGVSFVGSASDVAKPPTEAQIKAWSILKRLLQERYDIPAERIYAPNWIDYYDNARNCDGCSFSQQARVQRYVPTRLRRGADGM